MELERERELSLISKCLCFQLSCVSFFPEIYLPLEGFGSFGGGGTLDSIYTMSWSPIPGRVVHMLTRDGRFVKNRSSVL